MGPKFFSKRVQMKFSKSVQTTVRIQNSSKPLEHHRARPSMLQVVLQLCPDPSGPMAPIWAFFALHLVPVIWYLLHQTDE
jgi:hypothetical protein